MSKSELIVAWLSELGYQDAITYIVLAYSGNGKLFSKSRSTSLTVFHIKVKRGKHYHLLKLVVDPKSDFIDVCLGPIRYDWWNWVDVGANKKFWYHDANMFDSLTELLSDEYKL